MSALEGDRDAVMKALGDTIRALDVSDQWRILATTLNALEAAREYPGMPHGRIDGESAHLDILGPYWRVVDH